jgi:YggT family protein
VRTFLRGYGNRGRTHGAIRLQSRPAQARQAGNTSWGTKSMSLLGFIAWLIGLYMTVVFIYVILSWLIALDIVNRRNRVVYMIADVFHRLTEPALRPIRRRLPDFGGIDLSPVVLIFILIFLQRVVIEHYLMRYFPV